MRIISRPVTGAALTRVLLLATIVELAVYRLAVDVLRPYDRPPPAWHEVLNYVGLFVFYFASALAIAVCGRALLRLMTGPDVYARTAHHAIAGVGLVFVVAALVNTITKVPTATMGFAMQATFAVTLLVLWVAQLTRRGDIGAKVGLVVLSIPMLIQFYEPLRGQLPGGDEALWGGLSDKIKLLGQWSLVFGAIATPFCFVPKPFTRSVGRVVPLIVASVVALTAVIVMRESYDVGRRLAMLGLGVDIGATAPPNDYCSVHLGTGGAVVDGDVVSDLETPPRAGTSGWELRWSSSVATHLAGHCSTWLFSSV